MSESVQSTKRHNQGLTLVELMIAMVLSIVLLGGTIAIFMSTKETYKTQEELARLQENLRFGVDNFIKDVSPAGYMGCTNSVFQSNSEVTNTVTASGSTEAVNLYDFTRLIDGVECPGGADCDSGETTDRLTLRFAVPGGGVPIKPGEMGNQTDAVPVNKEHPNYDALEVGDVVSVSDCDAIAVFMITGKSEAGTTGNLAHGAGNSFTDGSVTRSNSEAGIQHTYGGNFRGNQRSSGSVYKLDALTYGVVSNTNSTTGKTVRSLVATGLDGVQQTVLAGVEDFQVEYGLDLDPKDGTADQYVTWDNVPAGEENNISGLRITIAVNSGLPIKGTTGIDDEIGDDVKTTQFTVKLRNRTGV